jgi:hypothetical protein
VDLVISAKSETVWKRRPAEVGFSLITASLDPLEEFDFVVRGEGDIRLAISGNTSLHAALTHTPGGLTVTTLTFVTLTLKASSTALPISDPVGLGSYKKGIHTFFTKGGSLFVTTGRRRILV